LNEYADALARTTRFSDEQARASEAVLLTFKNLSGDTLQRTLNLSADLATVMGSDVTSAAMSLGRALDAPGENMQMLSRAGVRFTDEQEKMIKAMAEGGRVAEAQAMILDVLQSKVGGVASEMSRTPVGMYSQIAKELDELKEATGAGIVEGIMSVGVALDGDADSATEFLRASEPILRGDMAAAVDTLAASVQILYSDMKSVATVFTAPGAFIGNLLAGKGVVESLKSSIDDIKGLKDDFDRAGQLANAAEVSVRSGMADSLGIQIRKAMKESGVNEEVSKKIAQTIVDATKEDKDALLQMFSNVMRSRRR
jgi:hypothetical protein